MSIEIFYHMFCVNDCVERFLKTYQKIKNSGLLDICSNINVCLVGSELSEYCSKINNLEKVTIITFNADVAGEMNTIRTLWEFCQSCEDSAVLYLHSKGASRNDNKNVKAWVNYMEYFVIERYKICLDKLKTYDTVGVEYRDAPKKHYSGNFWWANSSYIKKAKSFEEGLKNNIISDPRLYCEFWLLDNTCNACNLHSSGVNLYGNCYDETNYKI